MATTVKNTSSNAANIVAIVVLLAVIGAGIYLWRQHEANTTTINLPGDNKVEITE